MKWILLGLLNLLMVTEVFSASVRFKNDFCACKDGEVISYGNCVNFCASKQTNGAEVLYANMHILSANRSQNLNKWCNKPRPFANRNPRCALEAKDSNNNRYLLDLTVRDNNSFRVVVDSLQNDEAYILTLIELSTGRKSDSIQFIKYNINQ